MYMNQTQPSLLCQAHVYPSPLKLDNRDDSTPPDELLTFHLIKRQLVPAIPLLQTQCLCKQAILFNFRLVIIIDIDDSLLPLAGRDPTLEQNIDLTEGSVLHLRDPNVRHDGAEEGSAGPDVSRLAADVPLVVVEHVTGEEDAGNVDQVVGATPNTSCQWSETHGRGLTDDDPGGGGGTQAETDGDDQAERGLCVAGGGALAN